MTQDDTTRQREDVWTLSDQDPWHPTLLWYARGVAALQARDGTDFSDPTCWRYMAEIHGSEIAPSQWPAGATWNVCEHGSWYFLVWHRIYLHYFEKNIRAAIVELGGPEAWALPYWDYSNPARRRTRALPPAFRAAELDGRPNPLRVEERRAGMNDGALLGRSDVTLRRAFRAASFVPTASDVGFGGSPSGIVHAGDGPGALELTPHNAVHSAVGGLDGWMSDFTTAARDPIFWVHHANIDRLWQAWLAFPDGQARANPVDPQWLDQRFTLGTGSTFTLLNAFLVVDPSVPPLSYTYADLTIPWLLPPGPAEVRRRAKEDAMADDGPREMVGATDAPVPLPPHPTSVGVAVSEPTGPQRRRAAEARTVFLQLENVTAQRLSAASFDVFLNLVGDEDDDGRAARHVARVPMFGVVESSRADDVHSGSGLTFTFDITPTAALLAERGAWDPSHLVVTLEPTAGDPRELAEGDLQIGRVAVYYG